MGGRGEGAGAQGAPVRRARVLASFRSPLVLVAAVSLAILSMGVVIAHWASQTGVAMEVATGNVALEVTGDLTYDFPGCSPGTESRTCDKFDSDVIGTAPLSHTADGATFTITGWVYKDGDPSEPVGFYYTITGGTVDVGVKSGRNYDEATLGEGSGYWLNPACEFDPNRDGTATCSPRNTSAISHIDFCIKVVTPPTCLPLMRSVVASNVGSIPFQLQMSLIGPDGTDYCGVFDLTVHRVEGGSPVEPPLYQGPLCDLIGSPLSLSEQIDPGGSEEYKLTLSFTEATSDFNGTSGSFTVRFQATQWNQPGGWTDVVDLPMPIAVGTASSSSVGSDTVTSVAPARIVTETVRSPVNSALPTVIDVFGRSQVTITSWAHDPADPSAVLGFDFTVSGDPVYVEVQRGALGWVDERWEVENPHVWHDPYGVGSAEATPITSIEFALVPLEEEPPAEEAPIEEVPVEEPPVEEAPVEEVPVEEPPVEEPPAPEPATLTGIVWLDEDGDGARGAAEPGVAGVVVRLFSNGSEMATTITDANGSYIFTDLDPGDYTVEIEAPAGHVFAATGQGGDPALDSDVTPVDPGAEPPSGRVTVSLGSGESAGVADAGLQTPPAEGGGG